MKAISKTAGFATMVVILFSALFMTPACSNSKAEGPAAEFVAVFDKYVDLIKACKSYQDMADLNQQSIDDMARFAGSTYVLTDADKNAIKDAFGRLYEVGLDKAKEFTGQTIPAEQADGIKEALLSMVDKCKTLGDVYNLSNQR